MFRRFWWIFILMLPVGGLAGFLIGAMVASQSPKVFESEVIIQVKPSPGQSGHDQSPQGITPIFFAREFEIIRSRTILNKVVSELDLTTHWDMNHEQSVRRLGEILALQNIRGTDLISIRIRDSDRALTRDLAEKTADAYRSYRMKLESEAAEKQLRVLNEAVRAQEDKVEERRKALMEQLSHEKERTRRPISELPANSSINSERSQYELELSILERLKLDQISETISKKIPGDAVHLHQTAGMPDMPVAPNVSLILITGTILGVILSPLFSLMLAFGAHRLFPQRNH